MEQTQLSERQISLAIAYRDGYPEEIAAAIAENRRTGEQWHELYPFIGLLARTVGFLAAAARRESLTSRHSREATTHRP